VLVIVCSLMQVRARRLKKETRLFMSADILWSVLFH